MLARIRARTALRFDLYGIELQGIELSLDMLRLLEAGLTSLHGAAAGCHRLPCPKEEWGSAAKPEGMPSPLPSFRSIDGSSQTACMLAPTLRLSQMVKGIHPCASLPTTVGSTTRSMHCGSLHAVGAAMRVSSAAGAMHSVANNHTFTRLFVRVGALWQITRNNGSGYHEVMNV